MQSEDRTIYLHLLRQLRSMHAQANSGIMRLRSKNEASPVKMPGYYSFYCIHDRHKWNKCSACGRKQSDGDRERVAYLSKIAKLAQTQAI